MSPRNLPFESSTTTSPFVRTCAHARLSISATFFFWYESDASMFFHSSFVTESSSTSDVPKPSASSWNCSSALGSPSAGGASVHGASTAGQIVPPRAPLSLDKARSRSLLIMSAATGFFGKTRARRADASGMPTTRAPGEAAPAEARQLIELPADALGLVLYQLSLAHDIAAVAPTCHALDDARRSR